MMCKKEGMGLGMLCVILLLLLCCRCCVCYCERVFCSDSVCCTVGSSVAVGAVCTS
jgi:hypothetical protein